MNSLHAPHVKLSRTETVKNELLCFKLDTRKAHFQVQMNNGVFTTRENSFSSCHLVQGTVTCSLIFIYLDVHFSKLDLLYRKTYSSGKASRNHSTLCRARKIDPLCRASNPLGLSLIHIFPNSLLSKYLLSTYHTPDPVLMPRIWWWTPWSLWISGVWDVPQERVFLILELYAFKCKLIFKWVEFLGIE